MAELPAPDDEPAEPPQGRWIVKNLGEVAAFLGVELPTVWGFRGGANPMPGSEGQWDVQAITQWRCDRLKALGANAKTPEQIEIENACKREDLLKKQIANRLKAKTLVDRDTAKSKLSEILNEARMLIEAIPAEIKPLLPPDVSDLVALKVEQAIRLTLKKMAQKEKGAVE